MDRVTKCARQDASFAVIRNFQPARIERELLAQVFEIVGRGSSHQVDVSTNGQMHGDSATETTERSGVATAAIAETSNVPTTALERTA